MIATFYARVSTDRDEQQQSIENQVQYFKEYLKANNYEEAIGVGQLSRKDGTDEPLIGYYVDEGLTASKSDIKSRRAFGQMLRDANAKKFSIIFVKSISRFSRSVETTLKLIKDLKELGIGVYFDDLKMNSLDGHNEMLITMFASVAQEESRQKSESIHFGVMRGIKNGKWTSSPPFGYDKIDGYLRINEEEAKTVKLIFDWYLNEGIGIKIIALRLKELNVPTKMQRRDSKPHNWHHTTIKSIVNNPIYTGRMIQNRTRKIDINRGIVKFNPKEEYIIHHLEELRIIDDKLYKSVQAEKDQRMKKLGTYEYLTRTRDYEGEVFTQKVRVQASNRNGRHSAAHLFSNIFYCSHCNKPMRRRKNYHYKTRDKNFDMSTLDYNYVCSTYDIYGKSNCNFRNMIMEKDLLAWTKEQITLKQKDDLSFELEKKIQLNYNTEDNDKKIKELEDNIEEIELEKTGLIRMRSKGEINEKDYTKQYNMLSEMLDAKNIKLVKEKQIYVEIDKLKDDHATYVDALKNIDVDNITNQQLRRIISKITITTVDKDKLLRPIWKYMNTDEDELFAMNVENEPLIKSLSI